MGKPRLSSIFSFSLDTVSSGCTSSITHGPDGGWATTWICRLATVETWVTVVLWRCLGFRMGLGGGLGFISEIGSIGGCGGKV